MLEKIMEHLGEALVVGIIGIGVIGVFIGVLNHVTSF